MNKTLKEVKFILIIQVTTTLTLDVTCVGFHQEQERHRLRYGVRVDQVQKCAVVEEELQEIQEHILRKLLKLLKTISMVAQHLCVVLLDSVVVMQTIYVTEEDQNQHRFVGLVTIKQTAVCVPKAVKAVTHGVQQERHCTVVLLQADIVEQELEVMVVE